MFLIFDFRPKLLLLLRAHGNIAVASQLAFLHVGVAHAAINQDLLERGQESERLLRRIDLRLADDLHERRSGAVEIDRGAAFKMETLRHVFLQMDSDERHLSVRGRDTLLRVLWISEIVQRHRAPFRTTANRTA